MNDSNQFPDDFEASEVVERLFDRIPDVVFFVKDRLGRYRGVNRTLVTRCGLTSKDELLGRTTREVFPAPLGDRFFEQDRAVLTSGIAITHNLELHLYPTRSEGWCLTHKEALRGVDRKIIGVAGISRDLQPTGESAEGFSELAAAVECARVRFGTDLRVEELADVAGLSVYQLNRRLRSIFGLTASQLITKTRIENASAMLRREERTIAAVAHACGYYDQSAFSRVFKKTVGLTPQQYRARHRG